ncbi:Myc-type, basic helix-loop-helix [Sesbania bispinosa]|nr:Myc-type, basic helix-loop-helix [Sesbania bispinosa]
MNNNIPGWNFESDTSIINKKKPIGMDRELVELLWQNGQVVMHSQTHRKPVGNSSDLRQVLKTDRSTLRTSGPYGNSTPQNASSASASAQFKEKVTSNLSQSEAREGSVMTVGSSHCGSNQIPQDPDLSRASSNGVWANTLSTEPKAVRDCVQRTIPQSDKGKSEMIEPTVTSSSGGSGSSIGRTCSLSTRSHGQKRKATDEEASEEQNKASMLEEAIEYLKSLQLQLQVMWMGAGMTPLMFPGIQQYMSQMSMGMAPPSIHNPMQLPRAPHDQSIPNQALMCQNPVLGAFNYQNQMQNPCLSEQYARYMGYQLMQNASQPMNVFRYGTQQGQNSQTMITASNNSGPMCGADNIDDAVRSKMGSSTFN